MQVVKWSTLCNCVVYVPFCLSKLKHGNLTSSFTISHRICENKGLSCYYFYGLEIPINWVQKRDKAQAYQQKGFFHEFSFVRYFKFVWFVLGFVLYLKFEPLSPWKIILHSGGQVSAALLLLGYWWILIEFAWLPPVFPPRYIYTQSSL